MSVGAGGAAVAAPCAGGRRHRVSFREKVSGILVGIKKTKKEGWKIPVLPDVGSTSNLFLYPPRDLVDVNLERLLFPTLSVV